ncbi:MAG: C39 family peptidase [Ruminococcus sp.]|nr:C39 family peptidase [Ruminococcus sp.]MCM1381516.1 C39 family peptidase [Muribaculaceae bacterium]MCM1479269.1 C39 family peptidase [Muribaculaceae bacterium]
MKKKNITNAMIIRLTLLSVFAVILIAVILMAVTGRFEPQGENVSADIPEELLYGTSAETETTTFSEVMGMPFPETAAESTTVPESEETDGESTSETSVSRTIITSRVRKEYDSNSVYIDMENVLQLPELPVGCEITALTILLRYCGFDAEKTDLAKNYLPVSWGNAWEEDGKIYKDSFFDYFIGDPFSRGYGCFANAIEKAANAYIADHGGGFTVKNISGAHPDILYDYLAEGTPVLCWATDGMIEPEYYETWYDNATGEQLDWYLNEHCFVLAGFNMSGDIVTLNDPMKGIIDYNINKFETRYDQMYRQAIVILPNGGGYEPAERTETAVPETSAETETESETSEEYIDTDVTLDPEVEYIE